MLSDQTEKRVISFVRTVANDCTTCMRRCDENCNRCRSLWANSIMRDIESEMNHEDIDYSIAKRISRIYVQLRSANRPVLSEEIDMGGLCSFQLKLWTLKRMIKSGIVGRKIAKRLNKGRNRYFYFLKSNRETKNENKLP